MKELETRGADSEWLAFASQVVRHSGSFALVTSSAMLQAELSRVTCFEGLDATLFELHATAERLMGPLLTKEKSPLAAIPSSTTAGMGIERFEIATVGGEEEGGSPDVAERIETPLPVMGDNEAENVAQEEFEIDGQDKSQLAVSTFTKDQEAQAKKIFDRYDLVSSPSFVTCKPGILSIILSCPYF